MDNKKATIKIFSGNSPTVLSHSFHLFDNLKIVCNISKTVAEKGQIKGIIVKGGIVEIIFSKLNDVTKRILFQIFHSIIYKTGCKTKPTTRPMGFTFSASRCVHKPGPHPKSSTT